MKDWIALNMTPGVGPRVTARLLEHFGSAEAVFDAPRRDLALDVERQPFLGASGDEMHVAAHRPEEVAAAAEAPVFGTVVDVLGDELFAFAHAIDVFGD